ncbi:hypothetical protein [Kineosporia sp. R_H_3]|uniref:hypothetical protein n=1 Tax=Kineosporia sp. R_H_3 TaxID=1961848 RepID=UPI00130452E9|nr:hypothetical protein [Kineosporia sp. R_H_3]
MVGEVVPDERVEQVAVAGDGRGGDRHELSVPRGRRVGGGPGEQVVRVRRHEGGGDEDRGGPVGLGADQDGTPRRGVAADEAVEEVLRVVGHGSRLGRGADGALTTG